MGRPKALDCETAIRGAIHTFSEHGFEGTSIDDLTEAMHMCRRSLYLEFGDKWHLYLTALRDYVTQLSAVHLEAIRLPSDPLDGIRAIFDLQVEAAITDPSPKCLFMAAVAEFGKGEPEVTALIDAPNQALIGALQERISEAQGRGEVAAELDPHQAAAFLVWTLGGIQMSARAGASPELLRGMACLAQRSLR